MLLKDFIKPFIYLLLVILYYTKVSQKFCNILVTMDAFVEVVKEMNKTGLWDAKPFQILSYFVSMAWTTASKSMVLGLLDISPVGWGCK